MKVGDKVVLWDASYEQKAYADQFGIEHTGSVVHKVWHCEVIEVRTDVPGVYEPHRKFEGYRARAIEDGSIWVNSWLSHDESSMQGRSNTWGREGWGDLSYWERKRMPRFAQEPTNHAGLGPYVTEQGERCIPEGLQWCAAHKRYYGDDGTGPASQQCWPCYTQRKRVFGETLGAVAE